VVVVLKIIVVVVLSLVEREVQVVLAMAQVVRAAHVQL
jgi:hypothetical protein